MEQPIYVLLIDCPDQKGLVHHISGVLYRLGLNIIGNQEFVEHEDNRFFMRTSFQGKIDKKEVIAEIRSFLPEGSSVTLVRQRPKVEKMPLPCKK